MSGRVTERRAAAPIPERDLDSKVDWWMWLFEASDRAVDRWLIRPRVGDTRPSSRPAVFKPRQHFNMNGEPKVKLTQQQAQARVAGDDSLHAYRCSICQEWHVGHHKRRRAMPTAFVTGLAS